MNKGFLTMMMKSEDTVAVALAEIQENTEITVKCAEYEFSVMLKNTINFGHKFAVKPIKKGDDVIKYGEIIGRASCAIDVGEHVHVHNVEGKRGRGDKVAK